MCIIIPKRSRTISFVLRVSWTSYNDPDRYALTMASTLLGGSVVLGCFSRCEKKGAGYSVYSSAIFMDIQGAYVLMQGHRQNSSLGRRLY